MNFILPIICYRNMEPGGGGGGYFPMRWTPFWKNGAPLLHSGGRAP